MSRQIHFLILRRSLRGSLGNFKFYLLIPRFRTFIFTLSSLSLDRGITLINFLWRFLMIELSLIIILTLYLFLDLFILLSLVQCLTALLLLLDILLFLRSYIATGGLLEINDTRFLIGFRDSFNGTLLILLDLLLLFLCLLHTRDLIVVNEFSR
jgi:hypothetical protein